MSKEVKWEQVSSFPPVCDERAKILILGSMPGAESRRQQQYYANPRNHFWQILFTLFGAALSAAQSSYAEKLSFIGAQGIALWDVIERCRQKENGSEDATLSDAKTNDFAALFACYPGIQHVFFNGAKAYETFRRQIGFEAFKQIHFYKLTSSSPANAIGLPRKLKEWEVVRMKMQEEKQAIPMERLQAVQEQLLLLLDKLEEEQINRDETLNWERLHLASCARTGQILALRRGVDLELAGIACAVHDYGRMLTGRQKEHAANGYEPVKEFLRQCASFSAAEIEMIAAAVREHSSKSSVGTPLEEIVKDADVLDCHLYGLPMARDEQKKRLDALLKEIGR